MNYPKKLIPTSSFKERIDTSCLSDELLLRRSQIPHKNILNSNGIVKEAALLDPKDLKQFFGYSLNIKGVFREEHLRFRLDHHVHDKFWLKKHGIIEIDKIKFQVLETDDPIYIKVSDIHLKPFPIKKIDKKGKSTELVGQCIVKHKPINANYWHYEIDIKDEKGVVIKPTNSKWKISAAENYLKSYLKIKAKISTDNFENRCDLNSKCYESSFRKKAIIAMEKWILCIFNKMD